jgi:hypothetical protein
MSQLDKLVRFLFLLALHRDLQFCLQPMLAFALDKGPWTPDASLLWCGDVDAHELVLLCPLPPPPHPAPRLRSAPSLVLLFVYGAHALFALFGCVQLLPGLLQDALTPPRALRRSCVRGVLSLGRPPSPWCSPTTRSPLRLSSPAWVSGCDYDRVWTCLAPSSWPSPAPWSALAPALPHAARARCAARRCWDADVVSQVHGAVLLAHLSRVAPVHSAMALGRRRGKRAERFFSVLVCAPRTATCKSVSGQGR